MNHVSQIGIAFAHAYPYVDINTTDDVRRPCQPVAPENNGISNLFIHFPT